MGISLYEICRVGFLAPPEQRCHEHLDQVGEVLQKGIRVIGHVVHAVNKLLMDLLVVFLAAHGEDCFEFGIVHPPALNVVLLAP